MYLNSKMQVSRTKNVHISTKIQAPLIKMSIVKLHNNKTVNSLIDWLNLRFLRKLQIESKNELRFEALKLVE